MKETIIAWLWFIGMFVLVSLGAVLAAKGCDAAIVKSKKNQINPIKAHKCHDKGLSILLEDPSGSRNWQFVKGFKCRD